MRRVLMIILCASLLFSMAGCAQISKLTGQDEKFEPQQVYVENRYGTNIIYSQNSEILLAPQEFQWMCTAFRAENFLAVASGSSTADVPLRTAVSQDNGKKWTMTEIDVSAMAENRYIAAKRIQFLTPQIGFVSLSVPKDIEPWQRSAFLKTQDGGKTWSAPVQQNFNAADMIALSETELWAACGSVLCHSTDGGTIWLDVPIPAWTNGNADIFAANFFYYDGAWHLKAYQNDDRSSLPCYYTLQSAKGDTVSQWAADETFLIQPTVLPQDQEYTIQKPDPNNDNYEYNKSVYDEFIKLSRADLDQLWAQTCQLLHEYKIGARPGALPPPGTDGFFDAPWPSGVPMFDTLDPAKAVFVPIEGMAELLVDIPVAEGVIAQVIMGGKIEPGVPTMTALSAYFQMDAASQKTYTQQVETEAYQAINTMLEAYKSGTIAQIPWTQMNTSYYAMNRWPLWPKGIPVPTASAENTTVWVSGASVYATLTTADGIQLMMQMISENEKQALTLPYTQYYDNARLKNLQVDSMYLSDTMPPPEYSTFAKSAISPTVMCQGVNRIYLALEYYPVYEIGGKSIEHNASVCWEKSVGTLSIYIYDKVSGEMLIGALYDVIDDKMLSFSSKEFEEAAVLDFMQKLSADVQRIDTEIIPAQ